MGTHRKRIDLDTQRPMGQMCRAILRLQSTTADVLDLASPELVFQGESMWQNCLKFTESVQPMLLMRGLPKEEVQRLAQNARKELEELRHKHWSKVCPYSSDLGSTVADTALTRFHSGELSGR